MQPRRARWDAVVNVVITCRYISCARDRSMDIKWWDAYDRMRWCRCESSQRRMQRGATLASRNVMPGYYYLTPGMWSSGCHTNTKTWNDKRQIFLFRIKSFDSIYLVINQLLYWKEILIKNLTFWINISINTILFDLDYIFCIFLLLSSLCFRQPRKTSSTST